MSQKFLNGISVDGSTTINLSSEGTYFTGGSGNIRTLTLTSGTNISAHALHTFNIASSNGKYKFDIEGTEQLSLTSGDATFAGDINTSTVQISNGNSYNENIRMFPGSNDYSSLILGAVSGTSGTGTGQWSLVRYPTAQSNKFSIRHNSTDALVLDTSSNATFAGDVTVQGGDIRKGSAGFITIGDDSKVVSIGATNEMNFMTDVNSDQTMYLNHRGYNDGNTRFRSLEIRNGKSASIVNFNGSNKLSTFSGNVTISASNSVDKVLSFGDAFRVLKYDTNDTMSLQGPESVVVMLDNNNDNTDKVFQVRHGSQDASAGTLLFEVAESGNATFTGDVKGVTFNSIENAASGGFPTSKDYLLAGTGDRGGGLIINDISGARYAITAGAYDLTFSKETDNGSGTLGQDIWMRANATDGAGNVNSIDFFKETNFSGNATFTGDVTMTQSSGNNILYLNSSGGGNPVIYMQDSTVKWGQFVASGDLYFKNETTNVNTLILSGSNATFAGTIAASNFSGSSSGTNTGDQDLSGYATTGSIPTDFVSKANGGTFLNDITVDGSLFIDTHDIRIGTSSGATNETGIIKEGGSTYGLGLFTWGDTAPIQIGGGSVLIQKESGGAANLTVSGDLIVNGTTTTLNTTTVEVEDNILQLNTTQGTPDTATAATSGISIYRGDGVTQASLIFDDADDRWDLTNHLRIDGNLTVDGHVQASILYNTSDIRVLNKAGSAWLTFAERNTSASEAVYDLAHVGTITASGYVAATQFRPTNIVTNKVVKFNGTQLDDSSITDTGSLVSFSTDATFAGQVIFPSAATTKPVLPNGFISRNDLDDTSGRHDIWGISERYYPSNSTAGDAWGIQWSGTPNDIVFVGGGTDRFTVSLDEGNVTAAGTVSATGQITGASVSAAGGFLNGSNGGIRIHSSGTKFFNITAANAARDGIMDVGASDARFKDLFLSGQVNAATISTTGNATVAGGLIIEGSVDPAVTGHGYYESAGTNIVLKGDGSGRSGIFFESEKDGTNINDPSDYGFIQFHSYGYGNTSGEANNLVIGVANDSTDKVILQAPYNGGVMVGYKDATSGTGLTLSEVIHSNTSSYNNGNWDSAYTHSTSTHAPSNAEANQTAAQLLTEIKTVDGPGSGLDADTVDGVNANLSYGVAKQYDFVVNGDADKYYPIVIGGSPSHPRMTRMTVFRGYSETAPSTWNTASHKGGLTLTYDIRWGGWGGYPNMLNVKDFGEIYSRICGGVEWTAHTQKHVVWLRGGTANYHIDSPNPNLTIEVNDSTSASNYVSSANNGTWYSYDHSNNSYDTTVSTRTQTEADTGAVDLVGRMPMRYNNTFNEEVSITNPVHTQAWSTITSTPTTVSGYGITDAGTPFSGSWNGANMPGSRFGGYQANGGEIVFQQDNPSSGRMSVMTDGNFHAGENGGFYSLYSSSSYNSKAGFYADTSGTLQFVSDGVAELADFQGRVIAGNGSQAANSDAMLTLNSTAFSGLDIKSARTEGNIGGLRYYDTASDSVPEAQFLVEVDGSYNFYNGTNGAELRLKIKSDGTADFAGTVQAPYITANNPSGAANGSAQEVARFVNTSSGATSSYMYIGASSGTDWRLGKNINGTASNTNFAITKHSGTTLFFEIDGVGNTTTYGSSTVGGSLNVGPGPSRFTDQQNAGSRLELYNNRQDASNVEVYRIAAYNSTEVAGVHFYRGGGGNSGNTRIFAKKNNASNLEQVAQFGTNDALTSTFNEAVYARGGNIRIDSDGTYGSGYGTIGFGGTSNGYNKVFGATGTGDGLFLASATGRGVFIRTNGSGSDTHSFGSNGYVGMGIANNSNQRLTLAEADGNGSHIKMNNARSGGGYWVVGVGDTNSNSSIVDPGGIFFYNGSTKLKISSAGDATFAGNIKLSGGKTVTHDNQTLYNGSSTSTQYLKILDRGSYTGSTENYMHFQLRSYNSSEYSAEVRIHIPTYAGFVTSYGTMDAGMGVQIEIKTGGLSTQSQVLDSIIECANLTSTTDNIELYLKITPPSNVTVVTVKNYADADVLVDTSQSWTTTAPSNQKRDFLFNCGATRINSTVIGRPNLEVEGNILLTGPVTTTNQGRMIDFTGFDKEGITDFSDRAFISHTTNIGGHAGSVLQISSQNDVGDGIAFTTHASSLLRHNGNALFSEGHLPTWSEIESKPTTFTPSQHTQSATTITSGVLDAGRLPANLQNVAASTDASGVYFRSANEVISGEGWCTAQYAYNHNDGFLWLNRNTSSAASPVFHIGGYNNAGYAGYGAQDSIITLTRSDGSKQQGSTYAGTGLSNSSYYTNIIKTTTKTVLRDAQGLHEFTGNAGTPTGSFSVGSASDTNQRSLHLHAYVANKSSTLKCTDGNLHIDSADGNALYLNFYAGASTNINFGNSNSGVCGTLSSSGLLRVGNDVVAYYSFSDKRLKKDIKTTENNLDKILSLRPVEYKWKEGPREGVKEIGLIAQEVEKVVPEVVRVQSRHDDENYDEGVDYKQVDYEHLVSTLIGAMQEQQDQINDLKKEIQTLKNK